MICIGIAKKDKALIVKEYCDKNNIQKIFLLSPSRFKFEYYGADNIDYAEIITYKVFYRLLQEINRDSLIIINECLRIQNRYELTFNCIRNYLNQTEHQIIFQYLPIIDTFDDFMILVDWDTRSKWKRDKYSRDMLSDKDIKVISRVPVFNVIDIITDAKIKDNYIKKKRELIDSIGLKDPHTIPRNLLLLSGEAKKNYINPDRVYVGRNDRFKLGILPYKDNVEYPLDCAIFEFCHNFIDFIRFLTASEQIKIDCLISDLKVDQWYFKRYHQWIQRLTDAYAKI